VQASFGRACEHRTLHNEPTLWSISAGHELLQVRGRAPSCPTLDEGVPEEEMLADVPSRIMLTVNAVLTAGGEHLESGLVGSPNMADLTAAGEDQ